jgi:RNA polymerase sigma-70 factor (ECF subfamily)
MAGASGDCVETRALLRQARTGDRAAFERLFALHRPYLRQVIDLRMDNRLRVRLDASDIVQETQMEAFRRLDDYLQRPPMAFRLWLRKTAQERLIMAQRRHLGAARRALGRELPLPDQSSLQLAEQFLDSGSSPSQRLSKDDLARRMREALGKLSEDDREILLLRNLEALSNQEAAELLQIEPATASQRYGRALLRLGKVLAAHGVSGAGLTGCER